MIGAAAGLWIPHNLKMHMRCTAQQIVHRAWRRASPLLVRVRTVFRAPVGRTAEFVMPSGQGNGEDASAGGTGRAGPEVEGKEEEDKEECGWCKWMKAGGCADEFEVGMAWHGGWYCCALACLHT